MNRRKFVFAAAALGAAQGIVACGGSGGGAAAAGGQQPGEWNVDPAPRLFVGNPSMIYDLSASLPAGTKPGGQFSVDSTGARLPTGVTLSADGILSVTDAATAGVTNGVVFRYTEPA